MIILLMTALLLSGIDQTILKINPTQQAQAQISNTPFAITATYSTSLANSCQKLPVAGVTASANGSMAPNVLDNNLNTAWSTDSLGSWIQVNLGERKAICSLNLAWYRGNQVKYNFTISVSNDGTTFTNIFASKSSGATLSYETYFLQGGTAGRYVRITVNDNNNKNDVNTLTGIAELAVYGYSSPPSHAPTADDKNVPTNVGAPVQITLTGTDPIQGDELKFAVVTLPQHGSLA